MFQLPVLADEGATGFILSEREKEKEKILNPPLGFPINPRIPRGPSISTFSITFLLC